MTKLKLNKKQCEFIELIERCDFLLVQEIDISRYPISMITALESKGVISFCSETKEIRSLLK